MIPHEAIPQINNISANNKKWVAPSNRAAMHHSKIINRIELEPLPHNEMKIIPKIDKDLAIFKEMSYEIY